jgi:hypothetical protein
MPDLPPSVDDRKFIRGKDGWLFLAGDVNDVLAQQGGKREFSAEQLEWMRLLLEERSAWLAERGAPYFYLVAPEAHSVYPEMLPDDFEVAKRRPVHQLIEHLEGHGAHRISYPLEELWEQRHRPIYSKTGTHWTQLGALVALEALAERMSGVMPVTRLTEEDVSLVEHMRAGDLGLKVDPPERSLDISLEIRNPRSALDYDNRIYNQGRRIEYEGSKGDRTCLVFGDSSAYALLHLLAEGFRRLVFGHIHTLDRSLVEEVKPDVVITVMTERFLVRPPDDSNAPMLSELEKEKLAAGALLPRSAVLREGAGGRG